MHVAKGSPAEVSIAETNFEECRVRLIKTHPIVRFGRPGPLDSFDGDGLQPGP